ncbi:MAG: hypothetical protein ACLPYS_15545 [Vulcanimicrobiaceae bacterium]
MTNWWGIGSALKRWLAGNGPDVPSDLELCEFNCRKLECSHNNWENCERRKQFVDASRERQGRRGEPIP